MNYIIIDPKDGYEAFTNNKGLAMATAINHCIIEGLIVTYVQENEGLTTIWYVDPDDDNIYTISIEKNVL